MTTKFSYVAVALIIIASLAAACYVYPLLPEKVASHSKKQAELTVQKEKDEEKLKGVVQSLMGARIEMKLRATEKGGLFKTVGPKEIAQALKEQKNVTLPMEAIHPLEPIKTIGDHVIKVSAAGAESELMLKVTAS